MKPFGFAAALALAFASTAHAADERPQDRWNLADLYPDEAAWNADAARLEAQLKQFAACRGKLGAAAKRFRECLDLEFDIGKRYARLAVYAGEREAEDTGDPARQALNQQAQVIGTKLGAETAVGNPE